MWNASTFGQQFTATITAIAVDGHTIPFLLVKRLTVAHLQDTDFLSVGFRYIHLIVDACRRIEVEGEVLESQTLLVVEGFLAELQQMVFGRRHRVGPQVVRHLQMFANLFARQHHDIEFVLILIEFEHIGHRDRTFLHTGIKSEWGIEGDVGSGDVQLHVEDEVGKGTAAEITVAGIDAMCQITYRTVHILGDFIDKRFEVVDEILVNRLVLHVNQRSLDGFVNDLSFLLGYHNRRISHTGSIAGRIQTRHSLTLFVHHDAVAWCVVVSIENQVETRNLLSHHLRSILAVCIRDDTAVPAAVEQTDDDIRLFILLHILHPIFGRGYHLVESQSAPQRFAQPVGNCRRHHTDDHHLYAVAIENGEWCHVGRSCGLVNDVGSQHGTVYVANPFVVNIMPRFHIVIAEGLCIVLHVVDDFGSDVLAVGLDIIGIVAHGLSLQDVAVVEQDDILAVFLAQVVYIGRYTCQRTFQFCSLYKIVWEKTAVNITCLDDSERYGFLLSHCMHRYDSRHQADSKQFFHNQVDFVSANIHKIISSAYILQGFF